MIYNLLRERDRSTFSRVLGFLLFSVYPYTFLISLPIDSSSLGLLFIPDIVSN